MSKVKLGIAIIALIAIAGVVPTQAQTIKVMIAGSSAMWQTLALGAYNNGNCPAGGSPAPTPPCKHYTSQSNFNLTDTRVTPNRIDTGGLWLVWDNAATPLVWAYIKVDSVVGTRCYFAQPHCNVNVAAFPAVGTSKIAVWPDSSADSTPPASIQNLF